MTAPKASKTLKKVIIIGAGIGGLATANLLAKAGYTVEVYEQSDAAGGRVGVLKQGKYTFDTGPSWLLMRDVFEHYYKLFGTTLDEELDLVKLDPAYKVFFEDNKPVTITSNLKRDAHTFESIEPGAGSRLETYVQKSQHIYNLALKHFLYTNFSKTENLRHADILRNSPALMKLATRPIHSYVAARFSDQRLQQIMEYQMVFLGTSPYKAPAIYSLMSALDFSEGVYYPRGGMYELVRSMQRIGESLGVKYNFKSPVEKIVTYKGKATGIILKNTKLVEADIIISNADLHYTETKLLPPADQSYSALYWKQKTPSPSAILIYLGVDGAIPEFEHHNLLFVKDWKQNFSDIKNGVMPEKASLYICKTSATDAAAAPRGGENIFVLVPIPAGMTLDKEEERMCADHFLSQIRDTTGVDLAGRASHRKVYGPSYFSNEFNSWQSSMLGPSHVMSQSALFRTANRSRKLSNLYYVGAGTRPGIGLPMCLISAQLVYKQLAGDHSAGPLSSVKRLV